MAPKAKPEPRSLKAKPQQKTKAKAKVKAQAKAKAMRAAQFQVRLLHNGQISIIRTTADITAKEFLSKCARLHGIKIHKYPGHVLVHRRAGGALSVVDNTVISPNSVLSQVLDRQATVFVRGPRYQV